MTSVTVRSTSPSKYPTETSVHFKSEFCSNNNLVLLNNLCNCAMKILKEMYCYCCACTFNIFIHSFICIRPMVHIKKKQQQKKEKDRSMHTHKHQKMTMTIWKALYLVNRVLLRLCSSSISLYRASYNFFKWLFIATFTSQHNHQQWTTLLTISKV